MKYGHLEAGKFGLRFASGCGDIIREFDIWIGSCGGCLTGYMDMVLVVGLVCVIGYGCRLLGFDILVGIIGLWAYMSGTTRLCWCDIMTIYYTLWVLMVVRLFVLTQ